MERQVFITGATGTIGSALVPQVLNDPAATATLLIRARDEADLQSRLDKLHDWWGHAPDSAERHRVTALRGDIAEPDFGLGAAGLAALAERTSHIIHCAASVNLAMPLAQARATAVTPTRTVLAMARQSRSAGVLRKIDLVSTVGVWGRTPGVMPERPLPEVTAFHNTYEAAKAEAERVVWCEGGDLPVTVHRPSMVVGEADSGRVIHFQVFYHLCEFLSGGRTWGVMPALGETRLDTVPVDWLARVLDWSSRTPEMAGRILHLCAGPTAAIGLPELQTTVRSAWQRSGRSLPRLKHVGRDALLRLVPLLGALGGPSARRALRALPPVLEYLAEKQAFGNPLTAETLRGAALALPPVESYIDSVLAFYLGNRTRPQKSRSA